MKPYLLFIGATFLNVLLATTKTLVTTKGSSIWAAVINALTYGINVIVVYLIATVEFSLFTKIAVTMICNFTGVYLIKFLEKVTTKEKLFLINATFKENRATMDTIHKALESLEIESKFVELKTNKFSMDIFCYNSNETRVAKEILAKYNVKYCIIQTR